MSELADRSSNPLFGPQPFKIGLFGYLHKGGMALTKVPERWSANWDDIAKMAVMADEGGMDFLLPISSWKGWPGEIRQRHWSFETITHSAALSGLTKNIALLSTVHVPLVHPVFVAKALATVDHASHGRAGLNIVCGWNKADFDMFGVQQLEHDVRYQHGLEWFKIFSHVIKDGEEEIDFDGEFFKDHRNISGEPGSLQQPHPAILSAAYSGAGREFALQTSDFLFTAASSLDNASLEVNQIREQEKSFNRARPLEFINTISIVCRESRKEAEDWNRYYALENADKIAVDKFVSTRMANAAAGQSEERMRIGAAGGGTIVGTPEDVVDGLQKLYKAGYSGCALVTLDYIKDLPLILNRVLPLMEQAGMRLSTTKAAA